MSKPTRHRMTAEERREQLIAVARGVFAEKGYDGTAVEEIAARAEVSKPVVYEHFGGKQGLYAVVVDREVRSLTTDLEAALTAGRPRQLLEQAAAALLDYVDGSSDGFRILVRDSPVGSSSGSFATIMNDVASRVEHILVRELDARGYDAAAASMYAQMLVGMVGYTGQWWLDVRRPDKEALAAQLVNLAWNGLSGLERSPRDSDGIPKVERSPRRTRRGKR